MRVHVLKFTYRSQNPECADAIEESAYGLIRAGHAVAQRRWGSALVHVSRNEAFGAKDQDDCDFLMLVDDDMLPTQEAMLQLLELNAPVASAVCTTRIFPVRLAVKRWDKTAGQFVYIDRLRLDQPTKTGRYGVGAAFLMIRQDVRQKLLEHYLSADDWMEDNRCTFDRMHVRKEYRIAEKERISHCRRLLWEQDRYCRIFDHPIEETQRQMGEDIGLSKRLMQLNIPVTLDGRITVGHVGDYPYTVADYIPEDDEGKILDPRVGIAERLAG